MARKKITGHTHLEKDIKSGAIINTNRSALLKAKEAKRKRLAEADRINTIEDKIAKMEIMVKKLTKNLK